MSAPDPNSSTPTAAAPVPRPFSNSDGISTATTTNTARTPPSQPRPLPHRTLAPLPHHQHQYLYAQSFPIRRPGPINNSPPPHQHDPSSLFYPFAPSGRGLPARPVRPPPPQSSSVVDQAVTMANHGGYPPRPVFPYPHRQFGSTHLDPMMQFMRAHPQLQQFPNLGSGPQVGSGPTRGIPHFLQHRVAPPPSSVLDSNGHKNARSRDETLAIVRDRKVRISDGASLYALCRSWVKNGVHEGIQPQNDDGMKSLPKPLPPDATAMNLPKDDQDEEPTDGDKDEESVENLSEKDLLKRHVNRAKRVRARLREERSKRIARYKARLALLLPQQ